MAAMVKVLDLFSGLRGWSQPWMDAGHQTFTIDWEESFQADAHLDIGDTQRVLDALPWWPDVVLASPPCNSFSTMSMGRMWTPEGEPKHHIAVEGRRLVLATLRLLTILQPTFWVVENPRARLRTLELMAGIPRVTVTYCQYGEARMKPTDLWGRFPAGWRPRPACRNGDPCHVAAPRGSTTGTQGTHKADAGKIPYQLSQELMEAMLDVHGQELERPALPATPQQRLWA